MTDDMTWMERISALASKKAGLPGWHCWIYTKADQGGLFIKGAVCPPIKRGPRAGQPNFRKADRDTIRLVYLSEEECAP